MGSGTSLIGSLKARMFLSFTFLIALSLITIQLIEIYGIPFTPYAGRQAAYQEDAFNSLELTADLKKERLINSLAEFRNDVQMFGKNFLLRESVYIMKEELIDIRPSEKLLPSDYRDIRTNNSFYNIKQFLERIKSTYPSYNRVDLLEIKSSTILVSTELTREGTELVDYPDSLITSISPLSPSITMWKLRQTGKTTLTAAYPVVKLGDSPFSLDYLLIVYINTEEIINPMLHTGGGLGNSGEALLINEETKILAPLKHALPDGTLARPFEYQIVAEPARRAVSGEEGIIATKDYRGIEILAAYRYVPIRPGVGWGMVVKRDKSEIFASFRQSEFQMILVGMIFILITVIISTLLADSLSKPLNTLSRTAQLVELGNLDVRADVVGTSETKTLADALNSMLDRFQTWTTELDDQVKKRTTQLNEKNEELEQLVFVTSHDLRSPLVNIQGFSKELESLLKELDASLENEELSPEAREEITRLLKEETPEALGFISTSITKMDALLKGLLRLSRIGKTTLDMGPIDMNYMMREIGKSLEYMIKESGSDLIVKELPPVTGDTPQVNQVFSNLVENALKYKDPEKPGKITVTGVSNGREVVYCIEDNGIGVAPEFQRKVFEIFHRLDPSNSTGDGLGLTIVRKIMDRHKGKVWLESTPGQGSRFYVEFPEV